jgi:hypothetical protein
MVVSVGSEAAPLPFVRLVDQASLYGIAMHVTKFFDFFGCGEDIEVVIARFPYELFGSRAGETLFDDLKWRWIVLPGLVR